MLVDEYLTTLHNELKCARRKGNEEEIKKLVEMRDLYKKTPEYKKKRALSSSDGPKKAKLREPSFYGSTTSSTSLTETHKKARTEEKHQITRVTKETPDGHKMTTEQETIRSVKDEDIQEKQIHCQSVIEQAENRDEDEMLRSVSLGRVYIYLKKQERKMKLSGLNPDALVSDEFSYCSAYKFTLKAILNMIYCYKSTEVVAAVQACGFEEEETIENIAKKVDMVKHIQTNAERQLGKEKIHVSALISFLYAFGLDECGSHTHTHTHTREQEFYVFCFFLGCRSFGLPVCEAVISGTRA